MTGYNDLKIVNIVRLIITVCVTSREAEEVEKTRDMLIPVMAATKNTNKNGDITHFIIFPRSQSRGQIC